MEINFKNLFGLIKEKSVPIIDPISEQTRNAQPKAYIPKFIYKPPFGYPRFVDLPNIRRLAATPFVEMCVSTTVDELCAVEWDIVAKEGKEDSPTLEDHIKQVKNFYDNPNTNKESFEEIRRKYLRDLLEIDSGVINKLFNMKGEMVEIVARDGATFTKNPDIYGMMTDREDLIMDTEINTSKEARLMEPGWITAADAREKAAYFQYGWISGARPVPFGKKEIVWFEKNPRTDSIYGRSPVQVLAETIQTLIYSIEHNLEYFSDNEIPRGIIGLENSSAEEVKAFKDQWKENLRVKDSAGNWKKKFHHIPVTNKTPTFTRLELTNSELELLEGQKWWAKLVWACYDDKTEILTDDGFKLFKDLINEKVARVNPENLEIDFVNPVDKQEYDFDGELINYKTKSCDLMVTPEHKMLMCNRSKFYEGKVNWEEKQAKDFDEGIIPQAGNFNGEKIEKVKFGDLEIDGDDFCKFMGIWLSDGWIESSNNRVCLCASQVYPENMKFIENLLVDFGVDYKIKVSEPNALIQGKAVKINGMMNYYRFSNPELKEYLIQFGKAKEKFVPKIILNASKEQRELFLDAFMLGDGSRGCKGRNDRYGSMSKNLLDGLQEILIKNGKSATLFQNSFNGCWELTVRKNKSDKIKEKYYSRIIKENVSKQKYKGKVYDVTVPENHFLVVRRNGRVSISGNCFGVTATELGYTEESKGMSNQIVQSNIFKKRTLNPILRLEEYKHNKEIISEFEFDDIEFKFMMFDVEDETKKANLYKTQLDAGYKSINEIRLEEGLDEVEWGDKMSEQDRFDMNNQFGDENPFGSEKEDLEKESKLQSRTEKPEKEKKGLMRRKFNKSEEARKAEQLLNEEGIHAVLPFDDGGMSVVISDKDVDEAKRILDNKGLIGVKDIESKPGMGHSDKWWDMYHALIKQGHSKESAAKITNSKIKSKAMQTDNPLILKPNERMDDNRLKQSIVYLMKQNEKKIKELIEKEMGQNKLMKIKSVDSIAKRIKDLITFQGLKTISDAVIKNTFMNGWDSAEKQLDRNFIVNREVIDYIQNYTFNNIKGMTEEISQDLRQELERGIMSGEGITKIKARISKVFDVGENRADMIARTETNRSENQGKLQGFKASGEELNKKWVAAMDNRTSELCKRLNGQVVGINENFKDKQTKGEWPCPPAHVDCRSAVIYLSKEE